VRNSTHTMRDGNGLWSAPAMRLSALRGSALTPGAGIPASVSSASHPQKRFGTDRTYTDGWPLGPPDGASR
jgi:hypothetical protein